MISFAFHHYFQRFCDVHEIFETFCCSCCGFLCDLRAHFHHQALPQSHNLAWSHHRLKAGAISYAKHFFGLYFGALLFIEFSCQYGYLQSYSYHHLSPQTEKSHRSIIAVSIFVLKANWTPYFKTENHLETNHILILAFLSSDSIFCSLHYVFALISIVYLLVEN